MSRPTVRVHEYVEERESICEACGNLAVCHYVESYNGECHACDECLNSTPFTR